VSELSIFKPCPNCGDKRTHAVFDPDSQSTVWSCEICHTVFNDNKAITSLPDSSWDYAQIYYRSIALRREVEALFKTLEVDDGTPEVDQAIRDHLRQMSAQINAAMGELD
jgi:uncharacterized Zn finger protein